MQQSKTSSAKLLRKILSDLRENIWNYTNLYTYGDDEIEVIYSGNVERLKNMAEQAILNKEYSKALTYYIAANKYIDNQEYRFDVQINSLKRILDYIRLNQNIICSSLQFREKHALEINDQEAYLSLKKDEIKLMGTSITHLCKSVNELIESHYHMAASGILDIVDDKDQIHQYNHVVNYLRAKNIEVSMNEYESSISKDNTMDLIQEIRDCLENGQYDLAYKTAYKGIFITNNPIFYYYLGKICYKNQKIDQSLYYFNIYTRVGVEKYPKVQLYLYYIYLKKRNEKKAVQEIKNVLEIQSIFGVKFLEEFEYLPSGYARRNCNSKYRSDPKPYKLLHKIKMSEEEFLKRD